MSLVVRPQREDYFPKTKRGHGSAHAYAYLDPNTKVLRSNPVYTKTPCVDTGCALNNPKSANVHEDRRQNIREWCEEHGLSLRSKDRPNGQYSSPARAMVEATGGRD